MTWRCDVPGESLPFDTEAQADAAEKRIRADKGTRTCYVVVWRDGVGDDEEMSA